MAGAMRKMGEYLGLVEQADYDEYDDEPSIVVPVPREVEGRPASGGTSRADQARGTISARGPVSHIDEHRRSRQVGAASGLSRIETVTPRTYNDARTVGEHFRDGVPVILNLSEITDSEAKRLVDFSAGLVFSAHGSINRVTAKVFLLSPAGIDVTDEDKQRIAAGGFYDQH